jgi:hypothetical protein
VRFDLVAYATDCIVRGSVDLAEGRVTDALASAAELLFHDVELQALDDGRIVVADQLAVTLDELCAVEVDGPRGDRARRVRTVEQTLTAEIGPYRITADVHTKPTADLLASIIRQGPILAMTDAVIEVRLAGQRIQHSAGVLAVVVGQISSLQRALGRPGTVDLEVEAG